jgi:peptidylprolyl isomerase
MTEKKVKDGDTVKIHYQGTLDDGKVFDSSFDKDPIEFKVGEGKVIKGFNDGVKGLKVGENKKVKVNCEEAYGHRNDKLVQKVPKAALKDIEAKVGTKLLLQAPDGTRIKAHIIKVEDNEVTLDMNNPLAGKNLNFDLKVVAIN